jgi:hypothetical protein
MKTATEIRAEIERLRAKAETGEQWAHICHLEVQAIALEQPEHDFCQCDAPLKTEKEQRDGVCRECL